MYVTRNYLTTLDFIKRTLTYCSNKNDVVIITDKMPCYKQVCTRLGIKWMHITFGKRNYIEQVFRSFKFFTERFNHCICINLRKITKIYDKHYWSERMNYIIGLWCNYILFYWNVVKGGEAY